MHTAESALDNVEDFETNLEPLSSKFSMEKYYGITKVMMNTYDTYVRYTII